MSFIATAIAGTGIAASIAAALGTTAGVVGTVGATALTTGVTTGITKGLKTSKKKSNEKMVKESNFKSKFASKNPSTGYGGSSMTGNTNGGPNSIGSIIGLIGKAAITVGKTALENPEITKEVLGAAKTIGSQLIENRQDKKQGPNMEKSRTRVEQDYARNAIVDRKEGRTKDANYEQKEATRVAAGEAPSMMGYNPISKHMGGRGASMYGGPMMKGENVIVRDAKSGGKNQYNKRGK